jgi:hypothetical protein
MNDVAEIAVDISAARRRLRIIRRMRWLFTPLVAYWPGFATRLSSWVANGVRVEGADR